MAQSETEPKNLSAKLLPDPWALEPREGQMFLLF